MRILPRISPAAAVLAWCVLTGMADFARAEEAPLADMPPSGDAPARALLNPAALVLTASQWDAVNLGRAVDLWLSGDLRGAASLLEEIDVSPGSSFEMADRAAFLLAAVWLRLGDEAAFRRVADRAAGPGADAEMSAWRAWIRYSDLVLAANAAHPAPRTGDMPGADILAAALLMETGRYDKSLDLLESADSGGALEPLRLYLLALSREAIGVDPKKYWQQLSKREPRTPLESDLVGAAVLRLAAKMIAAGKDAGKVLERMPDESRLAPRAKHVRALEALERGDTADGRRVLESLLAGHPGYEASRDAGLALGGLLLDGEDWPAALTVFEAAEADWVLEYTSLERLEDETALDSVWSEWEETPASHDEIRLAAGAVIDRVNGLAGESLDLRRTPSLDAGAGMEEGMWPSSHVTTGRHQPLPREWAAIRHARNSRLDAESELARQERLVSDLRSDLERRLEYLRNGHDRSAGSVGDIEIAAANLDEILGRIDSAVLQLEAVRDSARLDIAVRTRDMIEGIRRDRLFVEALRHFHVEGPARDRPEEFPAGVPSPASLLDMEESLGGETESFLGYFAAHSDSVIVRSFDDVWEPRLTGESRLLRDALLAELDRARGIDAALDSALAWRADDSALVAETLRRDRMAADVDSLLASERALRRTVALAVAGRGRSRLEQEREAIDYSLADAAYELAVQAATVPETAEDTSLVAPPRRRAIARIETFLDRYPESPARGESRYRLADMRLMEARDDFQRRMAGFLGEDPSADDIEDRSLAPFVDYEPAISLYQSILAEDTDFPHVDAVLFNLGMILSDDGRPEAPGYLERLVREFPGAPDCQEAWLRMGSDRFDKKDFAGSVPLLEEAASGPEPQFAAIALYKLGWAHFEQDQFRTSADSFRRLMDLYLFDDELAADMDLRDEAEEYLVHSLARAGGASAFRDYFDAIGGRVYEDGILMSLGHLTRSVSLYDEAAQCDQLWVERYPLHPKSLAVSQRLVDTYKKWNKPDTARHTKLTLAGRFLPGGQWYAANDDAALRESADRFARSAWRESAVHHHKLARETDGTADWKSALTHYDRYLSQWPDAGDSDLMHFFAGETAARLGGYPAALSHFGAASESDSTALALDAAWQHLAASDAWYSKSVVSDTAAAGSDTLATVLLASGDDFIARFPADPRAADVVWRQGNIAYAHGWFDGAARRLQSMGEIYPADSRSPRAVRMAGDARYRNGDYNGAGATYENALTLAVAAGRDTLAGELEKAIPLCYYKHAEEVAGSEGDTDAAPLFAAIAERWPGFEHADVALYRAGLGYAAGGKYAGAAASWEMLLAAHPASEYARDSAVQIAVVQEAAGNPGGAAAAWDRFSRLYPDDPDSPEALLKAVDLLTAENDEPGAERMRSLFLERFPGETEAVMEIRGDRAAAELARVTAGTSILGSLLATVTPGAGASRSELSVYLELAAKNPGLASPEILAQVEYYRAEESYPDYTAMKLTQPLPDAIAVKRAKMEELLTLYGKTAGHGVPEYARASAYRIGQALIDFGDALIASERPDGLGEDDLIAYEEVLEEQSWQFYDRGENTWSELLAQTREAPDDPGEWIALTRDALWPRLAWRFLYRPEVEYPLVAATPPPAPGQPGGAN